MFPQDCMHFHQHTLTGSHVCFKQGQHTTQHLQSDFSHVLPKTQWGLVFSRLVAKHTTKMYCIGTKNLAE